MGGYNVVPSAIQRRIMGLGVPQDDEEQYDPNMLVPDPDSEEALQSFRPSDPLVGQSSSVEPSGIEAVTPKYGPESTAYLQKLKEMPQKGQFGKPSKTRKGLGVLAGIGTTVLGGGIAGGINEAKAVMEDPYRSALQDYYRNLEQNKTAAGVETGQIGTQTKAQEMIANREAARERAAQYRANAERFRYMTSLPYQEFQKELARIRHAGTAKQFVPLGAGGLYDVESGKTIPPVKNPKEPTNEFELWHAQNPDAKAEDYPGLRRNTSEYNDFKEGYLAKHPGANSTEVVAAYSAAHEAPQRPPLLGGFAGDTYTVLRPGQKKPEGFTTTQVSNAEATAANKQELGRQAGKDALNYAESYLASGQYTGPGDEALQEKFFELAKPSSGFRMTQPQITQLMNSRSWMESVEGIAYHAKTGQWFPPKQRGEIVATMRNLVNSHGAQGGPNAPTTVQHGVPQVGELFNGKKVTKVTEIHK